MNTELPIPKIKRRIIDNKRQQLGIASGLHPTIAKILASRPFDELLSPADWLEIGPQALDSPDSMMDMEKAVDRILYAIENRQIIGIETDHDCDGQTSHAVIYEALTKYFKYPKELIRSYIGHRLEEGYGLSEKLVCRILADDPKPNLIITADNGSSDEEGIRKLKQNGIDVIVTDHHEIPASGIPKSALAVINPTREDCLYPDRCIAGCMVAWLLMTAVRQGLEKNNLLKPIPKLGGLLDFVAVGTVADCVSIARSKNNRIVVSLGLRLIERSKRPCWQALHPQLNFPLRSEDLGFKVGPLLNSDGRLSSAFGSVSFLLSEETYEAKRWVEHLQTQNISRKSIQKQITEEGITQALTQYQQNKKTITIRMAKGHAGVHGISASRIKDAFGRPTIIFCPKLGATELLTGSARSVPGVHLKNILQQVKESDPNLIEKFGGHEGAAGLTIPKSQFDAFSKTFEQIVAKNCQENLFGPVIWSDGLLDSTDLNEDFVENMLSQLEPFGREFEPPQFEATVKVASLQFMGQEKNHARLGLALGDVWMNAVWFFCRKNEQQVAPVQVGDCAKIIYSPKIETFRGTKRLTSHVVYLERLAAEQTEVA